MMLGRTKGQRLPGSNFLFGGRARCPHRAGPSHKSVLAHLQNPKGIPPQSPGLPSLRGYPGLVASEVHNPESVAPFDDITRRALIHCLLRISFWLLLCFGITSTAPAHTPDTSYSRISITPHEVECKFSFDIATLQRVTVLDANNDGVLSRAELESAYPKI